MKKQNKTNFSMLSLTGLIGGILAYKNRNVIKEQFNSISSSISKYSGVSSEKISSALLKVNKNNIQEIINALSLLFVENAIDFNKINYDKIAKNIYVWFVFVDISTKSTKLFLKKHSIWELLEKEGVSDKLDLTIAQIDELKRSLKNIKKPESKDILENVKYNFQKAFKKHISSKKMVKVLKEKPKKPKKPKVKKTTLIKKIDKKSMKRKK